MARPEVIAFVALGANLGDPVATVRTALHTLAGSPGLRLVAASGLYRSAPLEARGPDFINAMVELGTTHTAPGLLDVLHGIEAAAGRHRSFRNAPRTLDLDLILYGDAQIASPMLTVPHPRWLQRAFVLVPLAEIAPQRVSAEQLAAVAAQTIERLPD